MLRTAILSPSLNAVSETFISAHRELIIGDKNVFYHGSLPQKSENGFKYNPSLFRRTFNRVFRKGIPYEEDALFYLLKRFNPNVVLAEYGTTAARSLPVIKRLNLPLVVHFHGFDAFKHSVIKTYKQQFEDVFTYSSSVIAVSKRMQIQLEHLGCPPQKIIYNPCGPREEFFDLQSDFKDKVVLSVGRFTDKKAPYYSVLAFHKVLKEHPDAKMVMIGDGELFDVVVNLAKYLKISSSIKFLGALSSQEVVKQFSGASVFIQHSITTSSGDSEGMPVSILEALASGLPVVSTDHAGIPEAVLHEKAGFIVPEHDVDGMAFFISELFRNNAQAKSMGEFGRKYVKENFSMEKHINCLNKCLLDACKK